MTTANKAKSALPVHIRWMIRRDMPAVLEIEQASFEYPWTDEDYIKCLRQRNAIGMIAELEGTIVGAMVYELLSNKLHILNLMVAPNFRFKGVGSAMVNKLKGKLSQSRRTRVYLEIRETNLDAHLFFRACGFKAVSVLRNFEATGEDAYLFQYRV